MNSENPYTIKYSNSFKFNGKLLAFRKRELFDITNTPKHIPFVGHWSVGRKQLSFKTAQSLVKNIGVEKDVSNLQWYLQEQLNYVFNLK